MAENKELTLDSPEAKEALEAWDRLSHTPQADTFMDDTQKVGVLLTIVRAVLSDAKFAYRQTLRTASFIDAKQSALASAAISEAERYGANVAPYITKIEAQNGERGPYGVRGQSLEALTHYTFQTNYQKQNQAKQRRDKPL